MKGEKKCMIGKKELQGRDLVLVLLPAEQKLTVLLLQRNDVQQEEAEHIR